MRLTKLYVRFFRSYNYDYERKANRNAQANMLLIVPEAQRQVFDAFALCVEYDRVGGRVRISAAVDDAVAEALVGTRELPAVFCTEGHGGGRIRTFEGRANAFTARPL